MPPEILDSIAPLIAVFALGSFVLIGMKLRYNHLRDTKHAPATQDLERVTEAVDVLQDQVRTLRDELVDLNERVDFAERVLTRGRQDEGAGGALPQAGE